MSLETSNTKKKKNPKDGVRAVHFHQRQRKDARLRCQNFKSISRTPRAHHLLPQQLSNLSAQLCSRPSSSNPSHPPLPHTSSFPLPALRISNTPQPPVLVPLQYILIAQVEAWPDLVGVVAGCLPRVQQPFQLEDAEDGVVAALLPRAPARRPGAVPGEPGQESHGSCRDPQGIPVGS